MAPSPSQRLLKSGSLSAGSVRRQNAVRNYWGQPTSLRQIRLTVSSGVPQSHTLVHRRGTLGPLLFISHVGRLEKVVESAGRPEELLKCHLDRGFQAGSYHVARSRASCLRLVPEILHAITDDRFDDRHLPRLEFLPPQFDSPWTDYLERSSDVRPGIRLSWIRLQHGLLVFETHMASDSPNLFFRFVDQRLVLDE
jgi:hypothetical protein